MVFRPESSTRLGVRVIGNGFTRGVGDAVGSGPSLGAGRGVRPL